MRYSALGLSLAVLLLELPLAAVRADTTPPARILTVSGSADVRAVPDQAVLQLGVTSRASNAQAAMEQTNQKVARIVTALKQLGIPDNELQTSSINLSPVYNSPDPSEPPVLIGFDASNVLVGTLHDLTMLGPAIDAAVAAGANQIQGISFQLSDDQPYRLQALQQAGARARAKAEALATGLGITLGDVNAVAEGGIQETPIQPGAPAVAVPSGRTPTPVLPGEVLIHTDVQVQFLLK